MLFRLATHEHYYTVLQLIGRETSLISQQTEKFPVLIMPSIVIFINTEGNIITF